jgi:uncharacterized protein (DUF1015 family)
MPHVKPFRGYRYVATTELAQLTCPPYDVISASEQELLHARHPHNAVRVELPFSQPHEDEEERYRRAGRLFRQWVESDVVIQDEVPSMYVYRQDFRDRSGRQCRVIGVIGALELERFGDGVLPHEQTMAGPIEDRLALIRSCPVNISPIYAIYRGDGELRPYYDSLEHRPTDARFADDAGTLHRLWVVHAPAELQMLTEAIARGPLVIADGHHRYETALAFHAEQEGRPGDHGRVMCFSVDADAEDLVVLPYHRAVQADVSSYDVAYALERYFAVKPVESVDASRALTQSAADHPFVFLLGERRLLVETSDADVVAVVGDRAEAWRRLDIVALHEVVLPRILPGGVDQIRFSKDAEEIEHLVAEGWPAGALLRPLHPVQVFDVAVSKERMPQKASYFWPKAVTGLAFHALL